MVSWDQWESGLEDEPSLAIIKFSEEAVPGQASASSTVFPLPWQVTWLLGGVTVMGSWFQRRLRVIKFLDEAFLEQAS